MFCLQVMSTTDFPSAGTNRSSLCSLLLHNAALMTIAVTSWGRCIQTAAEDRAEEVLLWLLVLHACCHL